MEDNLSYHIILIEDAFRCGKFCTMRKAVIVDIDGTLCELTDNPYIHTGNEIMKEDIWREIYLDWCFWPIEQELPDIIILTWRSRTEYEDMTRGWLDANGIIYDQLIMNMDWAPEKNHIFKKRALRILMQIYDIQIVYDDNPQIIPICKKLKLPLRFVDSSSEIIS